MDLNYLKKRKIAILGFGVENQSLYNYLVKRGVSDIVVCDRLEEKEFLEKNPFLKGKGLKLGADYLDDLSEFDLVFRTPGLPIHSEELIKAATQGVEITSAVKLLFDLCPAKIIGVTGTKGKGTTSTLIYRLLKESNTGVRRNIYLAGNIGQSAFDFLDKVRKEDYLILELSSFQLHDLEKSPYISVILNITSDHLDYHKTRSEYIAAKENIVRFQKKTDYAVINADYLTSFKFASLTAAKTFFFSRRKWVDQGVYVKRVGKKSKRLVLSIADQETEVIDTKELKLRGEHNFENISAALAVGQILKVSVKTMRKVLSEFKGLEHRLELVGQIEGVEYYNDSFSTNPEPTIAAISSFCEPIVLICGGKDKELDYRKMGKKILQSSVKALIIIGETSEKISQAVLEARHGFEKEKPLEIVRGLKTMKEIVREAYSIAEAGDVVILSPGAASFDMFDNYKERGNQFKEEVKKLKKS